MNIRFRIKQMISKHKLLYIVLCLELLVVFAGAVWACVGSDMECFHFQSAYEAEGLSLARGTYRAYINYESDDPVSAVTFISESADKHFLADTLQLYPWKQADYLQLWAYADVPDIRIAFHDNTGNARITEITIVKTAESRKMLWGILVGVLLAIDGLLFWIQRWKRTEENKWSFLGRTLILILAVAIVSAPLLVDALLEGDDLLFHLTRIEGIKDALQQGQFPVRVQPNWFEGAGYALSVFYGDFLLYLAAFLRILGFSLQASYKIYLFIITLGTVATTYYALHKISMNKWASTIGTAVYLLSTYRFCDMYTRASVGEYSSMMFTPLVLCGFFDIFMKGYQTEQTDARQKKAVKHAWIMPAVGMAGIMATHCITSLMITVALALWCVLNIRRIFKRDIFMNLCKTVLATIVLSAGWLFPFADYMINTSVAINESFHTEVAQIQDAGIATKQLFAIVPDCKAIQVFGMLYFFLVVIAAGRTVVDIINQKKITEKEKQIIKLIVVFVVLAAASSNIFPWNALAASSKMVSTFARTMQYPFRLAAIAQMISVLIFTVAFAVSKDTHPIKGWLTNETVELAVIGIMGIVLGIFVSSTFVNHPIRYKIYDAAGTGLFVGYGSYATYFSYGGEYLPNGVDLLEYRLHTVYPDSEVVISSYQKEGIRVQMGVENQSDVEKNIALPLLYYRGYMADYKDGSRMDTFAGDNFMVTVTVPAHYQGNIWVDYVVPWYWRMAEIVSLIGILYIILLCLREYFYTPFY